MEYYNLHTDDLATVTPTLRVGDRVNLSGTIYTARDAAHKGLFAMMDQGEALPMDIQGAVIYYAGPTPGQQGMAVGACGPTTSSRMNPYAPRLLELGLGAIIGKGEMSPQVAEMLQVKNTCYFAAVGGAGALIAKCITAVEVVAFDHLGCESIKKMTIQNLPLTVAMDSQGGNLYQSGKKDYCTTATI